MPLQICRKNGTLFLESGITNYIESGSTKIPRTEST
jgi:hypothetical protein